MAKWDACLKKIDLADMAGRQCWAGLDIGATSDFTALALLFPSSDGEKVVMDLGEDKKVEYVRRSYLWVPVFWLPEHPLKRDSRMQAIIDGWCKQGHIIVTEGETVKYDQVLSDIVEISKGLVIQNITIDYAFQGGQMAQCLQEHFGKPAIYALRQTVLEMAEPWRELLELLIDGRLTIDSNPVLRWMASNVVEYKKRSGGGLAKPDKDQSTEKIDGIVAAVMAMKAAMAGAGPVERSGYEDRGVVVL